MVDRLFKLALSLGVATVALAIIGAGLTGSDKAADFRPVVAIVRWVIAGGKAGKVLPENCTSGYYGSGYDSPEEGMARSAMDLQQPQMQPGSGPTQERQMPRGGQQQEMPQMQQNQPPPEMQSPQDLRQREAPPTRSETPMPQRERSPQPQSQRPAQPPTPPSPAPSPEKTPAATSTTAIKPVIKCTPIAAASPEVTPAPTAIVSVPSPTPSSSPQQSLPQPAVPIPQPIDSPSSLPETQNSNLISDSDPRLSICKKGAADTNITEVGLTAASAFKQKAEGNDPPKTLVDVQAMLGQPHCNELTGTTRKWRYLVTGGRTITVSQDSDTSGVKAEFTNF